MSKKLNSLNLRGGGGFLVNNNKKNNKDYNNINININININNTNNSIKNKISKISAFSLIELSIVLIIIGLLVAGITGGASLIESAKIRSIISEFNNINTSFLTFYGNKGKFPGDVNNDGNIGACSGKFCIISSEPSSKLFGGEYKGKNVSYQVGPWVELFLEGLTTFKPDPNGNLNIDDWKCSGVGSVYPYFKEIPNSCIKEFRTFNDNSNIKNGIYLDIYSINFDQGIPVSTLKKLDEKIDDGLYNNGKFFTSCTNGYNQESCAELFYNIYIF